ncbi:hypothetical protein M3C36_07230 [Dietzia cinnamea]|uniref:hypothetical protein n=1 Tax=Dietzia cinnamea TaxID=321318 RepID=UPI0021A4BCEE|nr:hypothetical protein [Dietzia cinnamea]MCT1884980.1 hypothetical protein [Dietzia cinnamea]
MTEHNNDFRPLPVGWYTKHDECDDDAGDHFLLPVPGLIRAESGGPWVAAGDIGGDCVSEDPGELVYRPDLAHLPGELKVRVVGGVEYVRPEFTSQRRVLGPDTPFPGAKSAYSAEA